MTARYDVPASWYDRIYEVGGKDYAAEAAEIVAIIAGCVPAARSLLDVGCGTGVHLEHFARDFDEVAGIDLEPAFVDAARARRPGASISVADMCTFDLSPKRFDAVVSLFSSVGHLPTLDALTQAIERMAAHVAPGGVLIIEPWWSHETWTDGIHGVAIAESDDSILVRTNRADRDGDVTTLDFHWVEVTPAGTTTRVERFPMLLAPQDAYRDAFARVGFSAGFVRSADDARPGLWVARA